MSFFYTSGRRLTSFYTTFIDVASLCILNMSMSLDTMNACDVMQLLVRGVLSEEHMS